MRIYIIKSDDKDSKRFEDKVNKEIKRLEEQHKKIKDIKFHYGKEGADAYHFAYILYED